jgi:PTS system galactitol-specific IIC component
MTQMQGFFEALAAIFDWLISLNNFVVMPVIIFLFAWLWFRAKPADAFRAALRIAIGYVGLSMIIGFLITNLGPATSALVENLGLSLTTVDVGLSTALLIGFGTPVALTYIPVCILVNLIMLALRWTKTINIDIWNFWHFVFIGSLVYAVTGSFWYGTIATALSAAILLVMADITQPYVEDYFNIPGVSIPHGTTAPLFFLAWPFVWLVDRIPGLKDIKLTPESIQNRFGAFGEPAVLGLIVGLLLGALAGWPVAQILPLGVIMAGVFFLLTRIVAILVEGLMPVAEAAKVFLSERYAGRQIFIGLDSALQIGDPGVMATALLMIPITLGLAVILPGNKFLISVDLVFLPFAFPFIVALCRGNLVKSVIVGSFVMAISLYLATWLAPVFTDAALAAGMDPLPEGLLGNCMFDGGFPLPSIFTFLAKLLP